MSTTSIPMLVALLSAVLENTSAAAQQMELNKLQRSTVGDCQCPENMYTSSAPNHTFTFSNEKQIVACGYGVDEQQPDVLSEFVLAECGVDTVIDFWSAMTTCRLAFAQDTLSVQELYQLPIGDDFQIREIVWTIEEFSYKGGELMRKKRLNRDLKLYNNDTIKEILEKYQSADDILNDEKMRIVNQLFSAALTGHREAKIAFLDFYQRFPDLSAAYRYQYRVLTEMLSEWEKADSAL